MLQTVGFSFIASHFLNTKQTFWTFWYTLIPCSRCGEWTESSKTRAVDETALGSVLSELRWGDRRLDHKSM